MMMFYIALKFLLVAVGTFARILLLNGPLILHIWQFKAKKRAKFVMIMKPQVFKSDGIC